MPSFTYTVFHRIKSFKRHPALAAFMAHNQKAFSWKKPVGARPPVVLFELNAMHSAHIAYSYLANILSLDNDAEVKAYQQRAHLGLLSKLIFRLKKITGWGQFGAYKSFGVNDFIAISLSSGQRSHARALHANVVGRVKCTLDVQNLEIDGVWVGDLIYDTFLMSFRQPTINVGSDDFHHFLLESMELFVFWRDYLDNNDVRGINVSHCVYNLAMPLRLAVQRSIPVFQINVTHAYRLSKQNLFAYNDFFQFRERFAELPLNVREAGIKLAERRIRRRFAGEVGVDMSYSTKSAYAAPKHDRLLRKSMKKKILIATHCFFDSPHSYGNNIFPDFYEWLDFLGKITECTDYDWYIKTHPDYLPGTKEIIDNFVATYPKFTLLPSDASHHQIIDEGIDLALTAYGTIAFEYAALGIPVINASQNNPHIAYDFNLHAKDVEDYRRMLLDLNHLDFQVDKRQVYEYYFMRYIYNTEDLFFENYDKAVEELGGYDEQFTPAVYEKWLEVLTPERHVEIQQALRAFIKAGAFRMDYTFYGREFSMASLGVEQ